MADALDSVERIATFIKETSSGLSSAVTCNMNQIVETAKQEVVNYTGQAIDSNSIDEKYVPAIINLAKSNVVSINDFNTSGDIRLAELTIGESDKKTISDQLRQIAQLSLSNLGRKISFARSIG